MLGELYLIRQRGEDVARQTKLPPRNHGGDHTFPSINPVRPIMGRRPGPDLRGPHVRLPGHHRLDAAPPGEASGRVPGRQFPCEVVIGEQAPPGRMTAGENEQRGTRANLVPIAPQLLRSVGRKL
jgi:hypothetical protein